MINNNNANDESQFGEDVIIRRIFEKIPSNKCCLEFGAWDGITNSNSIYLIREKGYKAILIEANKKRFRKLKKNLKEEINTGKVLPYNSIVGEHDSSRLEYFLSENKFPLDFDFISIDIDSDDLRLLITLGQFKPKVVCIEYNFTFPIDYMHMNTKGKSEGNSYAAIDRVLNELDYDLVGQTQGSLIYLERKYLEQFNISKVDFKSIWNAFFYYDGEFKIVMRDDFLPKKIKSLEMQKLLGQSYFNLPFSYVMKKQLVPIWFRKWPRNQILFLTYSLFGHLIRGRISVFKKYIEIYKAR